jgi:branched-subunit amino acid ABC-type transport system permease component
MAAMAWMVTPHTTTGPSHQTRNVVIVVLALCLLTWVLRSLTRDMPTLRSTTETTDTAEALGIATPGEPYRHFWDGTMALGTATCCSCPTDHRDEQGQITARR